MEFNRTNLKQIGKNNKESEVEISNKSFWFDYYFSYFVDILTAYYEWSDFPEDWNVDKRLLEINLISRGYMALIDTENYGKIVVNGTFNELEDDFQRPSKFQPIKGMRKDLKNSYNIAWSKDEFEEGDAIVIPNSFYFKPSTIWLQGFCQKLAEIEQTIQINRNAQKMPMLLFVDSASRLKVKNIYNQVQSGNNMIEMSTPKDDLSNNQPDISRYFQHFNTQTPYLIDKLTDDRNNVINQIITRIGINNMAIDKAERINVSEANSNNGLIMASMETNWKPRREACKLINECYGSKIEVFPSPNIAHYNTEKTNYDFDFFGGVD